MNFKNSSLDTLLSKPPYGIEGDEKRKLLLDSVAQECRFHLDNNDYFKKYYLKKNIDLDSIGTLEDLPPVHALVFKEMGEVLSSVGSSDIIGRLQSSATGGVPSTVQLDRLTAKRQVRALAMVLADRLGKERRPFLIIDLDPRTASPRAIGARAAAVKGFLNLASGAEYFIEERGGSLAFNLDGFAKAVSSADKTRPLIVFGFTYVLYSELIERCAGANTGFDLPEGSMLVHIGGWKKLANKKVSRDIFNSQVEKVLGLEPDNIVDFYGFTEQMGLTYPDCECGWKHTPSFSEVIIRSEIDGSVLSSGKQGVLEFITPIPHSYPGNVILTDDIGIEAPADALPCAKGRKGKRFRVVGRRKKSEVRGCGDVMASKMAEPEVIDLSKAAGDIELLYQFGREAGVVSLEELEGKIAEIKEASLWLRRQKVDTLIGLIDKVAMKWKGPEFEMHELQQQGLSFLANWCASDNLKALADNALGRRGYLDQFLSADGKGLKLLKAAARGTAVHWLSGNVPVLGMLVLIQTIISKNASILKASHSYSDSLPVLLKSFEGEEYTTPGGETVKGDDLLKSICVLYFSRENKKAAALLSSNADIRVAWGGADAVSAVVNLPKKYDTEDITFGPKLSFMAVGKEFLTDDRKLRKIIKRASVDASVFDQTACASPHTIFVESGGEVSPREFAERLGLEMEKTSARIPAGQIDAKTVTDIENKRAAYDFIGELWGADDSSWTVLFDENLNLSPPTYGRVITVKPVDDIFQTIDLIDDNIQTIGLALKGEKRLTYAGRAADKGAVRFPEIGMMTHFEDPWDGLSVLQRSVRWISLGGPV